MIPRTRPRDEIEQGSSSTQEGPHKRRRISSETYVHETDEVSMFQHPHWVKHTYYVGLSTVSREYQKLARNILDSKSFHEAAEANKHGKLILARILRAKLHVIHPKLLNANYGEFGIETPEDVKVGGAKAYNVHPTEALSHLPDGERPQVPLVETVTRKYEVSLSAQDLRLRDERREAFLRKVKDKNGAWKSDRTYSIVELVKMLLARREEEAQNKTAGHERKRYLATHKILVFSEYLSALDLVEVGIKATTGIEALRYDATCSNEKRIQARHCFEEIVDEVPKDFSKDYVWPHEVPIMLVSNKASADGITLMHASDIIHIGTIWNPFNEDQAINLADKIGRTEALHVHHFLSKESIEDRVMRVHECRRGKLSSIMDEGECQR
ncbi:hypothetical protein KC363_g3536 [Hortaea werneckii]|nr:hypothetical protein KC361_g4260 [Hortaea werneckii]KAI6884669.1 hypothetical protein KC325_g4141 [Hortaea werneckii]KAI6994070.1 hypothetical protein KC359_g4821 [Hortaea werneckii]KAI7145842.1 hypothetical protein KC344_g4148 [Hortaea werneckii]KAI7174730.1 hypothetical protein KC360_g4117 [Hortaea werneckii]